VRAKAVVAMLGGGVLCGLLGAWLGGPIYGLLNGCLYVICFLGGYFGTRLLGE